MTVNPNIVGADNVMRMPFVTYTYETDPHYQARTSFYFGIVQEIAGMHAACRHLSVPELQQRGMTWVILRTRMHIDRYTCWPEDIYAETWAQEPIGLQMPRTVRGYDEQHILLFEAVTDWAVLDLEHHFRPVRPQEITNQLRIPFGTDKEHARTAMPPKRFPLGEDLPVVSSSKVEIQLLDTDANHHVNNISYLYWMLEDLPNDFRDAYKISDIDVSWKKQTFLGDKVTVVTYSGQEHPFTEGQPQFHHKIVRKEKDGTETVVFEGTTSWERREKLTRKGLLSV